MTEFLSGKVKKTPSTQADPNRYKYLKLSDAEPDLGVPEQTGYVLISDTDGNRAWVDTSVVQGLQGSQGVQGPIGNFGGASFDYTYSNSVAQEDPGVGKLRFNDANITTAIRMYIDDQDDNGTDIQTFLRTIDDSTSTIKGHFRVSNRIDSSRFVLYTISSISE